MLFTLEPLMPDLFIYDNVRCSLLVPRILHIKMQQAAKKKKKKVTVYLHQRRFCTSPTQSD